MGELRFFLSHYFAIGLLTLISYVLGSRLLFRVHFESNLEQACFAIALGLGVLSYLVLFLGLLGLLYPSIAILILLISVACCHRIWARWPGKLISLGKHIGNVSRRRFLLGVATALVTLTFSMPILLLPLYPPTASDETMYHLPVAKQNVENHRTVFAPQLRYPVFPQTNEMLFTLALLFYDDGLARQCELLLMVVLALTMTALGLRFFSPRAGWWASAILLANPLVLWCGTVCYVEIGLMVFITMSIYGFWNWWQTKEQHWLILAGVFCGSAIGTKYTALFFLILLQGTALYIGFKQRKYVRPMIFGLVAFAVSSPWFVRNFYYMRNPLFPYFYEQFARVFGFGRLNPEYYAGMTRELSAYGIGKSLRSLISLPWHLSFNQSPFVVEAPLSSLYFFLLPLLLIGAVAVARIRGLLIVTAAYTLFWFYGAQVLRYLLPALPLLSLASGATLDYFFAKIPHLGRLNAHKTITFLGFAVLVFPGWHYAGQSLKEKGPLPVTQSQRDAHLAARLPSYPAYQLVNRIKGANYTIYACNDANMNYFADGLFMGDWFGPAQYGLIYTLTSGEALYRQLKTFGTDYFLLRSARWPGKLPNDEFFKSHFHLIYAKSDISLYEITERPFQERTVELLQNPGFEQLTGNSPAGWMMAGRPFADSSGKNSATGVVAMRCNSAADVLYQSVPVKAEESYTLASQTRGIGNDETAKLQVNWLDVHGRILKEEIEIIKTDSNWKHFEKSLVPPPEATTAVIYADGLDRGPVWFDDVSFGEVTYIPEP